MVQHFPNLLQVGPHVGLEFALLSDDICTLLLIVGFVTRPAALISLTNLTAAYLVVHDASFFQNDHAGLFLLYIGATLILFITGPGRYSADLFIAEP